MRFELQFKIYGNLKIINDYIEVKQNPYTIKIFKDNLKSMSQYKKLLSRLPKEADEAFKKIREGRIKIDIEDTDISKLSLEIDRSSNRIAYGMVIAALVLGGAWAVDTGSKIYSISYLSLIFFIIAAVLFIILIFSIIREKRLKGGLK